MLIQGEGEEGEDGEAIDISNELDLDGLEVHEHGEAAKGAHDEL